MTSGAHPVFVKPLDSETSIWRYMDFTKFVAMLEAKALFFARADTLGDPFEGSFPKANSAERAAQFLTVVPGKETEMAAAMAMNQRFSRSWTFVSCWHMNEAESAAMWRLYARTAEAIAVKTTVKRLDEALDDKTFLGQVSYINFESAKIPSNNYFHSMLHKRLSFAHEHELRAVKWLPPATANQEFDYSRPTVAGVDHPVDFQALIDKIYVAPTCPGWFKNLVEKVTLNYKIHVPVMQSSLDAEPMF